MERELKITLNLGPKIQGNDKGTTPRYPSEDFAALSNFTSLDHASMKVEYYGVKGRLRLNGLPLLLII